MSLYDEMIARREGQKSGGLAEEMLNRRNGIDTKGEVQASPSLSTKTVVETPTTPYDAVRNNSDYDLYASQKLYASAKDAIFNGSKANLVKQETGDSAVDKFSQGLDKVFKWISPGNANYARYQYLTDDELKTYTYLNNSPNYGVKAAEEYLDALTPTLNKRMTTTYTDKAKDFAENNGLAGATASTLASTGMNLLGGYTSLIGNVDQAVGGLLDSAFYGKKPDLVDAYNGGNLIANVSNALTEGVTDSIDNNVGKFLYGTGKSILDSGSQMLTMRGLSTISMALNATASRQKELQDMGANDLQTAVGSALSGAIEYLTEKWSVGNLLKEKRFDTIGGFLKEIGKQMVGEASEEGVSEILNAVVDRTSDALGGVSDYDEWAQNYLANGGDPNKLEGEYLWQKAKDTGLSMLGGAISGGVMGSIGNTGQYIGQVQSGKQIQKSDKVNSLKDQAQTMGRNDLAERLDNGKARTIGLVQGELTDEAIGKLKAEDTKTEDRQKAYEDFQKLRENYFPSSGVTDKKGNALKVNGVDYENETLKTDSGDVKFEDARMSDAYNSMLNLASDMNENEQKAFIQNFEGDLQTYFNRFNMLYEYGKLSDAKAMDAYIESTEMNKRAALNIYEAGVRDRFSKMSEVERQNDNIRNISNRYGKIEVDKNVDDSIISYDGAKEGKIDFNTLKANQRANIQVGNALAKGLNVNAKLFNSKEDGSKYNGYYDPKTNTIYLDVYATNTGTFNMDESAKSENAILTTMSHELSHWGKTMSPKTFMELRDVILPTLAEERSKEIGKDISVGEYVMYAQATQYGNLTEEEVEEELVARACENMLLNSEYAKNVLNQMSEKEAKTFVDKAKELLQKVIKAFKEILGKISSHSEEYRLLSKNVEALEKAQKLYDRMLLEGSEVTAAYDEALKSEETRLQLLENNGFEYDKNSDSFAYSYKTEMDSSYYLDPEKMAKLLSLQGIDYDKALKYIKDMNGTAEYIFNNADRLGYPELAGSAIVPNAEYGGSVDFNTLCTKARLYIGTLQAIKAKFPDAVWTPGMYLHLRRMMLDNNLQSPCGCCYVQGSRAMQDKYLAKFIEQYKNEKHIDKYIPTMYDVTTPDGIEKLRIKHPGVHARWEYFMNNGRLSDEYKRAFGSQMKPKQYMMRKSYKGEILDMFRGKEDKVGDKNDHGGFRLQSFSDFEIVHLIDCMQVITDMSMVGLYGQAYTKVPEFAEALGYTGLKINCSLIAKGVDESGKLILDDVEGMKAETAFKLRTKYAGNVGTVVVCFTEEQIKAALADNRIDYVLPFHHSQWKKSQFGADGLNLPEGTKSFQQHQNERVRTEKGTLKKRSEGNFFPKDYWVEGNTGRQNGEHYLDLCNSNNVVPKFPFLLETYTENGKTKYKLPDGAVGDGYYKLLIDFRMYADDNASVPAPQRAVVPNFNMEECNKMLKDYEGGHNSFPVAKKVANEFIDKYHVKASTKDNEGTELSKKQIEFFKDSKLRDDDGNLLVLYRGHRTAMATDTPGQWYSTSFDVARSYASTDEIYAPDATSPKITGKMAGAIEEIQQIALSRPGRNEEPIGMDAAVKHFIDNTFARQQGYYRSQYAAMHREGALKEAKKMKISLEEWVQTALSERNKIYKVYINAVNPLVIDAKGKTWNEIRLGTKIAKELGVKATKYTTDEIVDVVEGHGYDAIVIKNVSDYGDYAGKKNIDMSVTATDVIPLPTNWRGEATMVKSVNNLKPTSKQDIRYSEKDSSGKELTAAQASYFKHSRARSTRGNLKRLYHGTNSYFTKFDPKMSDDGISLFFVDKRKVAQSYSGTMKAVSAEKMQLDLSKVTRAGLEQLVRDAVNDGKSYEEVCNIINAYLDKDKKVGVKIEYKDNLFEVQSREDGEWRYADDFKSLDSAIDYASDIGMLNYGMHNNIPVYLNLVNPLVIDGRYSNWLDIPFSTAEFEGQDAIVADAFKVIRDDGVMGASNAAGYLWKGERVSERIGDYISKEDRKLLEKMEEIAFAISDPRERFTYLNTIGEQVFKTSNTRKIAQYAKSHGYDGVIIKNIYDMGSNGWDIDDVYATVYIAFDSDQVKSIDNANPTKDSDIRYSAKDSKYDEEKASIREQIKNSREKLISGGVKARLSVPKAALTNLREAENYGISKLKEYGSQIDRNHFGTIYFGDSEIGEIKRYANVIPEKLAIGLVPMVCKRGEIIGRHTDHKGRKVPTITFGSQVEINGVKGLMAVTIKETRNTVHAERIFFDEGFEEALKNIIKNVADERIGGVVENDSLAKSASATDDMISPIKKSVKDSEYLELAKNPEANRDKLQKMVDEAAERNGYTEKVFHGTVAEKLFNTFNSGYGQYGSGVYFTYDDGIAGSYGKVMKLYVKMDKMATYDDAYDVLGMNDYESYDAFAVEHGFDSFEDDGNGGFVLWDIPGFETKIKSADLVTYDDSGNIIPLSQRFSYSSPDIRYSYKDEEGYIHLETGEELSLDQISKYLSNTAYKKAVREKYKAIYSDKLWEEKYKNKEKLYEQRAKYKKQLEDAYKDYIEDQRAKYEKLREDYNERIVRNNLKDRIINKSEKFIEKLDKNDKQNHVPDVLKEPLVNLLNSLKLQDLGNENIARKFSTLADKMKEVSGTSKSSLEDLSMYFDTDSYFVDSVRDIVAELDAKIEAVSQKTSSEKSLKLTDLSTESLRAINDLLSAINQAAYNYDRALSGDTRIRISQRAESSRDYLKSLGKKTKESNRLGKFIAWENVTQIYAFDRFGNGGKEIFRGFMDGQDKLTRNTMDIVEFCKSTFSGEEADAWAKEIQTVNINGEEYQMTTAQIMELYCLNKRKAAHQHMFDTVTSKGEPIKGRGIVIKSIKLKGFNKTRSEQIQITRDEVKNITSKLTARQKEVADALQKFMSKECADWGNYITMRRFGILQFGEDNYYPMSVDREGATSEPSETPQGAAIFKILNMSFTHAIDEKANGALFVGNIFDTFLKHANEMAVYNAMGLPILDAFKWMSYSEENYGTKESMKTWIREAYGSEAVNWLLTYLTDLNGQTMKRTSLEEGIDKLITNYKTAAVSANLRVALMQPTAYIKALSLMDGKYLRRAFSLNPSEIKEAVKDMKKSPIGMWKNELGMFDLNVGRSTASKALQTEDVKGASGWKSKIMDKSMILAEKGDEITWGMLYKACQLEVKDTTHFTGEAFDEAVNERFREVCYRTQVFDSINSRSQAMRSKNTLMKILTAFGSEPTLSYSMLSNELFLYAHEKNINKGAAWQKHGKNIMRTFFAWGLCEIAVSMVAGIPDMIRDDEDEESFIDGVLKYFKKVFGNFASDSVMLPFFRDAYSVTVEGFDPSRPDEEILVSARKVLRDTQKIFEGKEVSPYKTVYDFAKLISHASGIPLGNVVRGFKSVWNKLLGDVLGEIE